ncbi:hypothetical protein LPJ81_001500, partial [Coemansia sp. IMI 209127]
KLLVPSTFGHTESMIDKFGIYYLCYLGYNTSSVNQVNWLHPWQHVREGKVDYIKTMCSLLQAVFGALISDNVQAVMNLRPVQQQQAQEL